MGVDRVGNPESWAFEPGFGQPVSQRPALTDTIKWTRATTDQSPAPPAYFGLPYDAPIHPTADGRANIQRGTSGTQVSEIQNKLNALSFNAGAVDGDYGPRTARAIRAFQSAHGLAQTGIADTATVNALDTASANANTPTSAIVTSALESGMAGFFNDAAGVAPAIDPAPVVTLGGMPPEFSPHDSYGWQSGDTTIQATPANIAAAEDKLFEIIIPERRKTQEMIDSMAANGGIQSLPSAEAELYRLDAFEADARQDTFNPETGRPFTEIQQQQALLNSLQRQIIETEDDLVGAIIPEQKRTQELIDNVAASDGIHGLGSIDAELERLKAFEEDLTQNTTNPFTGSPYTESELNAALINSLTRSQGNLRNIMDGWQYGNGLTSVGEPHYVLEQADEADRLLLELHSPVTRPVVDEITQAQNGGNTPTAQAIMDSLANPEASYTEGELWALLKELDNRGILNDAFGEITDSPVTVGHGFTTLALGGDSDTAAEFLTLLSDAFAVAGDNRIMRETADGIANEPLLYAPLGQALAQGSGINLGNQMLTALGYQNDQEKIDQLSLTIVEGLDNYSSGSRSVVVDFINSEIELAYQISQEGVFFGSESDRAETIHQFREVDHPEVYSAFSEYSIQSINYLNDLALLRSNPNLRESITNDMISTEADLFRDLPLFLRDPGGLEMLQQILVKQRSGEPTLITSLSEDELRSALGFDANEPENTDFANVETALFESAINLSMTAMAEGRVDDADQILATMAGNNSFLASDAKTGLAALRKVISPSQRGGTAATQFIDLDFDDTANKLGNPKMATAFRLGGMGLGAFATLAALDDVDIHNGTWRDELLALNSAVGWGSGTLKEFGEMAGERMANYYLRQADNLVLTASTEGLTYNVGRADEFAFLYPFRQTTWGDARLSATYKFSNMDEPLVSIGSTPWFKAVNGLSGATGFVTVLLDSAKVYDNLSGDEKDWFQAGLDGANVGGGLISTAAVFYSVPTPATYFAATLMVLSGVSQFQYNRVKASNIHENAATQRIFENILADVIEDPERRRQIAAELINSDSEGRMTGYIMQGAAERLGITPRELIISIAELEPEQVKVLMEGAHGIDYDEARIFNADNVDDDSDVAELMNREYGTHESDEVAGQLVRDEGILENRTLLDDQGELIVDSDGYIVGIPTNAQTRNFYALDYRHVDPLDSFRYPDHVAIVTPQSIQGWINYADALGLDLRSTG